MGFHPWCGCRDLGEALGAIRDRDEVIVLRDGRCWCSEACAVEKLHGTAAPAYNMQRAYPDAFAEDAKRLAELRGMKIQKSLVVGLLDKTGADVEESVRESHRWSLRRLESLVAVYEECQSRGRLFGGLR